MKSIHSTSVVRLTAVPKRTAHQVILTKPTVGVVSKLATVRVSKTHVPSPARHAFKKSSHQALTASLGMTLATGMLGKLATVLLVPMLFLQPLLPLYAADESVAPPEAVVESTPVITEVPPPTPEPSLPVETPSDGEAALVAPVIEEIVDEAVLEESSQPSDGDVPTGDAEKVANETEEEIVLGEATTTPEAEVVTPEPTMGGSATPSDTSTSTEVSVGIITDEEGEVPAEEIAEELTEEVVAPEIAPSQEDVAQAAREREAAELAAETARQEAARLAMRKEIEAEVTKGCLTIDDVGYYCLKNFEGSESSVGTTTKITSIQSLQDPSGSDKEIFISKDGTSIQITHNTWDDTFPAMDVTGKSLVWQGMTEGRWQIFFADLSALADVSVVSPVIVQVTHSAESNFNPRVDGNTVVWQGWVSGNWEIFLADHLSPSSYYPDGEEDILPSENRRLGINGEWHVARLSENDTHDMFPAISGGLVTWQSFQNESWNVYAYNMKTGESTQLSQAGVKSENPRFAVTWDERDANGNTRMVGYDIASGKTIDLTDAARQSPNSGNPYQPENIPVSGQNQAALPPSVGSGTSTPMRADGDEDGGTNGLEI